MSGAPVFTSGDQVSRGCPPGDALSSHVSGSWGAGFGGLSSWVSGDCDNLKGSSWPAANPGNCTEPEIYTSLSEKEASVHPTGLGGKLLVWSVSAGGPRRHSWPWMPSLFSAEGSSSDALIAVTSARGHLCIPLVWVAGRLMLEGGHRTVSHLEEGIKNLAPQGSAGATDAGAVF